MRLAGLGCRCRRYFSMCDNHHLHAYFVIRPRINLELQLHKIRKVGMDLCWRGRLCPQCKVSSCSQLQVVVFEG